MKQSFILSIFKTTIYQLYNTIQMLKRPLKL